MRTFSLIQNQNTYDQLSINAFHGFVKRISDLPGCTAIIKQANSHCLLIQESNSFSVLTAEGMRPEIIREEDLIKNQLNSLSFSPGSNDALMKQLALYLMPGDELVAESMTSIGDERDFGSICLAFIARHIDIRFLDQTAFSTKLFEQLYEQESRRNIIASILTGMYNNTKKILAKDMPKLWAISLAEAQSSASLSPYERRNKPLTMRVIRAFHTRCGGYMENAGVQRFIEEKFGREFRVKDSTFRVYVNEAEVRYHEEEVQNMDRWLYLL